jgi:Pyruvate:ferredoxin oxidoreductase and related 2-oxoacid:ferredoxin oxidoreductases, gamma subunit
MEYAVIISGFGGQGLLFAGTVLARAAMAADLEVFWIPTYGPEMRGGSAACTVIIGDRPIGSPVVDRADAVIALSGPALARYRSAVAPGGLLVVDGTMGEPPPADGIEVVAPPCTKLARAAGDDRLVSVVALGALVARRPMVDPRVVREALREVVGAKHPEALRADLEAFDAGVSLLCSPESGRGPGPIAVEGGA